MAFLESLSLIEAMVVVLFGLPLLCAGIAFLVRLVKKARTPVEPVRPITIDEISGRQEDWEKIREVVRRNQRRDFLRDHIVRNRRSGRRKNHRGDYDGGSPGLAPHHYGIISDITGDSGSSGSSGGGFGGGGCGGGGVD